MLNDKYVSHKLMTSEGIKSDGIKSCMKILELNTKSLYDALFKKKFLILYPGGSFVCLQL